MWFLNQFKRILIIITPFLITAWCMGKIETCDNPFKEFSGLENWQNGTVCGSINQMNVKGSRSWCYSPDQTLASSEFVKRASNKFFVSPDFTMSLSFSTSPNIDRSELFVQHIISSLSSGKSSNEKTKCIKLELISRFLQFY